MAKKCLPGVICIENMTFVLLILIFALIGLYMYRAPSAKISESSRVVVVSQPVGVATRNDPMNDPYSRCSAKVSHWSFHVI